MEQQVVFVDMAQLVPGVHLGGNAAAEGMPGLAAAVTAVEGTERRSAEAYLCRLEHCSVVVGMAVLVVVGIGVLVVLVAGRDSFDCGLGARGQPECPSNTLVPPCLPRVLRLLPEYFNAK